MPKSFPNVATGFVIMLVLAAASSAMAQSSVGVQPGVSIANVVYDPDEATGDRFGLQIGVNYERSLLPFLVLRPELRYAQRGFTASKQVLPGEYLGVNFGAQLDYLEVPVFVKAKGFPSARVRPFALAGPVAGMRIAANCTSSAAGVSLDCSDNLSRWELALEVGAGVEVSLGSIGVVELDLRYTRGLTDVDTTPAGSMKHTAFSALVGYSYQLSD